MRERLVEGAPATVVTPNRLLGPFETPAAALRFSVRSPLDLVCLRSGWYGPDLDLVLDGGERVVVPLAGLRLRASGPWTLRRRAGARSDSSDEPALLSFLRWWEMPVVEGCRVRVSGSVTRPGAGYRDGAHGPALLRRGFLEWSRTEPVLSAPSGSTSGWSASR